MKPNGHCDFSECRKWRYTLWRNWGGPEYLQVIGLNPSTADETKNDPTVTRCIDFAKRWGFGGLCMTNLFAFRATDPREMKRQTDPIGEHNNRWLYTTASFAGMVLCAWGNHGTHMGRAESIASGLQGLFPQATFSLGLTKAMQPKHPLYIRADTKPLRFPTPFRFPITNT